MKNLLYILLFLPLAGFGQENYSLSFDGVDDYIKVNHNSSLELSDLSITFWMKTTNSTSGIKSLIAKENFTNYDINGEWWVYINHMQADKINFYVIENNIHGGSLHNTLINDDIWHFVSVTRNGLTGEQTILIDGQNAVSVTGPSGLLSDPVSLYFGGGNNYNFDGLLDDISIWNTVITQQDIQSYMYCHPTGNEEGIVGYWNFNEGSGNTVYDTSENGNHGAIYGGATYSEDVPEMNCFGCTDNFAINYDDLAGVNDSSCTYNTYPLEDENFKSYLQSNYPQTIVNDSLNINATLGIVDLNVDSLEISSLDGLQYFYDLINLNCVANNLSTLPELPSQIEYINCQWNQIDTLPNFPESLKNFDGRHNLITVVPPLPNTMEVLRVCFNEVNIIPALPDSLKILFCAYNYEQLTYLPDFPDHLEEVLCFDNEIGQISDIPETMYKFMMQNNSITQIPNIPEGVNILNLSNNPIECVNDYPEQFEEQLGVYPPCSFIDEYTALMDSLDQLSNSNDQLQEDLSVFETIEEEQDYSMSFDGVDDYVLTSYLGIYESNQRTISVNASNGFGCLFSYGGESDLNGLKDAFLCFLNESNNSIEINIDYSTYQFQLDELLAWNNFTIVLPYNSNSLSDLLIYQNGDLLSFLNGNDGIIETQLDVPINIGRNFRNQNYFSGSIKGLSFWDLALSQEQIQSYISCPPTGEEDGLVGYWNFNEGSGNTVYDLSGNGNHGTINGAIYSEDVPESYKGCTDETALNFDIEASCDNSSCVYGDEVVSNLEDLISTVNTELDNTVSSLNDVIETWQSSIDLTNESLDAISGITQMLNSFNSVIYLSEGWNMIGYGCPEPMDVEESLSDYTDLILIAKANNGSAYLPEYEFNGIGDFTPGYGYQLKTSESIEEFSLCYNYTVIDNTQITDIENDNAQMQNDVNCLTGNPQIGDYCYGGIVFYVAEGTEGKYGLVASELILEGASDPYNNGFNGFEWGCHQEYTQGVNLKLIGSGKLNTLNIDGQNCASENGGIIAAIATLNFEIESYLDWYLPSIDELVEMEEAIGNIGLQSEIDTVTNNWYWSSTQYNDDFYYAEYVDFGNNGSYQNLKYSSGRVRAIRYFGNWTKGCMDSLACNYNLDASMADGSCEYADEGYDCDGNELHISMSFDGFFDNVQTNNSNSIDVNHSISIGFSIKPNTWNTGDENCIVSKKSSDNSNGFVVYNDANTTPRITLRLKGSLTEFPGGIDLTSNSPVEIDEWQSWFFVYDTTTSIAKIYKNGILDTTYYSINNVGDMSNSSDLYFGLPQHPSWNGFYDGLLYDVSIWEVALDQFQIQSFFNCSLNGNEEGLVGYWKFNEGEGSIVNDSSGKGNHGTINGASYSTDIPEHNCE